MSTDRAIRESTLRIFANGGTASDGGDNEIDTEIMLLCTRELLYRAEQRVTRLEARVAELNVGIKHWYDVAQGKKESE